ncbi:T9SS type A sorting domain-containing protein, partial [Candidatus Poribacteria bacterium]|nr:T9SS type A sorting domain-containing protein [Candidatus Poribacteria bacterium]
PDFSMLASSGVYPDVNGDGVVDVRDLVAIAAEIDTSAGAPTLWKNPSELYGLIPENLKRWIALAEALDPQNPQTQKGIAVLEQLLRVLNQGEILPPETALLSNYPNPFNPETWIPYQLEKSAEVNISIHSSDGQLIRQLAFGHLPAGIYHSKSRSAYWDGRNALGESVASGVYFYTLTAGDFIATGKMLIRK